MPLLARTLRTAVTIVALTYFLVGATVWTGANVTPTASSSGHAGGPDVGDATTAPASMEIAGSSNQPGEADAG